MTFPLTRALRSIEAALFPSRLAVLRVLLLAFLAFNALLRLALTIFNGELSFFLPWRIVPAMLIGALFDLGVAAFFLAPLAALLAWWPARYPGTLKILLALLLLPLCVLMVFVGAAELVFWNEFASRFNFIAVDYLIYTNEVIGNIRESYNMPLLLSLVAVLALALWGLIVRSTGPLVSAPPGRLRVRSLAAGLWILAPFIAFVALDARYKEFSSDAQLNELAGNGYYDFWHAFRSNEIDYERFYTTLPLDRANRILAQLLDPARPATEVSRPPFERTIAGRGPEKRLNVVLISVEALSADFLAAFGNRDGLTPRLDRLAAEGMLFTHMYATGTRTVRGLEALTLSAPPTPGNSIVKRPDNGGLFSLGEVFREKGYEALYLYGGYAYFDNMDAFFSGNGYTVIDRTALKPDEITFENIWGVADEDLFRLAIAELDKRYAARKPFFAHIMTVSNHRPFAYPAGRIDIPTGTREGAVKYTDFAIGQFIDKARAKPWFDRTLFVIIADHTHKGRGRTELPLENYHIPLIVYAPRQVPPSRIDTIASQIDVGPTILGMLDFSYRSLFFGHDILKEGVNDQRALLANYQTVGYYRDGIVVELKPKGRHRIVDAATGRERAEDALSARLMDEAISYYQLASRAYKSGQLKLDAPH
ncbi:MAG TPA: LTA synthase family protein [Burkholderiales bacterium]|nr:LTA synthase family protein [Burkholderiales bacterium]